MTMHCFQISAQCPITLLCINENYPNVNIHIYPKDFRAPWPIFSPLDLGPTDYCYHHVYAVRRPASGVRRLASGVRRTPYTKISQEPFMRLGSNFVCT